jgi:ABC-type glycerol-3-phosphate transport system permease component
MAITSFKPNGELLNYKAHNPFWISSPTLAHVKHLLFETDYPHWLMTTMSVAISAGIFSFTLSWNEFIYALAFIQSSANKTVPVAILTELVSGDVYQWGALMAGSLLGSLPVAIFYSLFVDYYVSSLTGAVKE